MKKKEIPKFRFEALEVKFIEHLTIYCNYMKDYGGLSDYYNIK
jgi:hypothetical protein